MKELPPDMVAYQRTKEFTNDTVPAGLLRSHTTKRGVWGRIHVLEGSLCYRILEPKLEEIIRTAGIERDTSSGKGGSGMIGIIEPENPHEVECIGKVRFYVEFLRHDESIKVE
jgi:tellurite resistance-related uncharacterized protein